MFNLSSLEQRIKMVVLSFCLTFTACGGGGTTNPPNIAPDPIPPLTVTCIDGQTIRFNEAVSSNSIHQDTNGDTPDWFELYSCSATDTILLGWTLTDNVAKPDKWKFPDEYVMPSNTYLRIWASKNDTPTEDFHTNFKISSSGETLYLFDDLGVLVDSFLVENVPTDNSIGISNEGNEIVYFEQPTPGAVNSANENKGSITSEVIFSHTGGAVAPLTLELSGNNENQDIRYTTNATEPHENSALYTQPIVIDNTTVVRARILQTDYLSSSIQSHSYLVNVTHNLPIVTLITEPDNFFNNDTGIYVFGDTHEADLPFLGANFWDDVEKPINVSLYEKNGQLGINFDAGVKIFGGWSRANEQRSLSLFARSKYGVSEIDYPMFPELEYDKYQALVLRNSGNDWLISMLRDGFMTQLMQNSGLDTQAYRPVATYLNDQYWGMYNLREKINEHFIASKHNVDIDELDILEKDSEVIHGNADAYNVLASYISNNSLAGDEAYNYVSEQIDINNYIMYQLAQIYFNNTDWPGNNIKFWKAKEGKWRWILFDTDFGFGIWNEFDYFNNTLAFSLEANGPDWPNPPWSTFLFRKLIENETFKQQFINQFADELNSRFLSTNISTLLDQMMNNIAIEMPKHFQRWKKNAQTTGWEQEIDKMKRFGNERSAYVFNHIADQFQLGGVHTVNIDNLQNGTVTLNSLLIEETPWSGSYFDGVPITLTANPNEGYVFSHWAVVAGVDSLEEINNVTTVKISVSLTEFTSLWPVFIQQ